MSSNTTQSSEGVSSTASSTASPTSSSISSTITSVESSSSSIPSSTSTSSSSIPVTTSTSTTSSTVPSSTSTTSTSSIISSTSSPSSTSTSSLLSSTSTIPVTTSFTVTSTTSGVNGVSTTTIVVTSTSTPSPASTTSALPSTTTTSDTGLNTGTAAPAAGGLSGGARTAVAVVVPIVGVALLALAGIYFWRRRKQRKDAEELRRKEVEDYGYNPNNDPTLPSIAGGGTQSGDGPFEMREGETSGYRGWGTTVAGSSTGRKASTTLSGGGLGTAYSDGTSPTHAVSDTRSGDPLVGQPGRPVSDESEALGVLGPAAAGAHQRNGDIHRGPSDASSSYSVNRSDASGEHYAPGGYGQGQYYSDNGYSGAYGDGPYAGAPGNRAEMGGQPIIRDNLARRATRIENPSHFPAQPSAGISQNF